MLELVANNKELGPKTLLAPTQISISFYDKNTLLLASFAVMLTLHGIFID